MNICDLASARSRTVTLSDGRALGFSEYGSIDGTPVLFIPGAASGRAMNFGGQTLLDRDIRLISVDRPGLGASDPDSAKSFNSVSADLAELLTHLELGTVPAVANSQGAPFALALACAHKISSLTLVSPMDEVAHPVVRERLPEEYRALIDQIARDPLAARERFERFTARDMWDMVMSEVSEYDAPVYGDDEFRALYRTVLEQGFAQGAAGYAADTVLAMSDWNLPLSEISIPVNIWFGDRDDSHSPDLGEHLASRIPTASRHLVSGTGGSLLWDEPSLFLGLLD